MDLEVLTADDWAILAETRLRALADAPGAFISDHAVESALGETEWRHMFDDAVWVIMVADGAPIGLARSIRPADTPADERYIESVWIASPYRGSGVLRTMFKHLTELEPDVSTWFVWVFDDNHSARAAYERLGFETDHERQEVSGGRCEERLRLTLGTAGGR